METRNPKVTKWINGILEKSKTAIAIVSLTSPANKDFKSFNGRHFWGRVPRHPDLPAYLIASNKPAANFSAFEKCASDAEKAQFIKNQTAVLQSLDEELLSIKGDPLTRLRDITYDRYLSDQKLKAMDYPAILFDYILSKKETFGANPSLRFILNFDEIAQQALDQNPKVLTLDEFGWAFSKFLNHNYGVGMNASFLLRRLADKHGGLHIKIGHEMKARQTAQKAGADPLAEPPTKARPTAAKDIVPSTTNQLKDEYDRQTQGTGSPTQSSLVGNPYRGSTGQSETNPRAFSADKIDIENPARRVQGRRKKFSGNRKPSK